MLEASRFEVHGLRGGELPEKDSICSHMCLREKWRTLSLAVCLPDELLCLVSAPDLFLSHSVMLTVLQLFVMKICWSDDPNLRFDEVILDSGRELCVLPQAPYHYQDALQNNIVHKVLVPQMLDFWFRN